MIVVVCQPCWCCLLAQLDVKYRISTCHVRAGLSVHGALHSECHQRQVQHVLGRNKAVAAGAGAAAHSTKARNAPAGRGTFIMLAHSSAANISQVMYSGQET